MSRINYLTGAGDYEPEKYNAVVSVEKIEVYKINYVSFDSNRPRTIRVTDDTVRQLAKELSKAISKPAPIT